MAPLVGGRGGRSTRTAQSQTLVRTAGNTLAQQKSTKRLYGVDGRSKWHKNRTRMRPEGVPVPSQYERLSMDRTLADWIQDVPLMAPEDLPRVIDRARAFKYVEFQEEVVLVCLMRILACGLPEGAPLRRPRPEQVRTLRRLIFGCGDTFLIARTGFGKSVIFHAFTVLTRKITLQLIPLNKLGDEQLHDIRSIPGTNPCLLNAKTRTETKRLIEDIALGKYTHVLLGPEQASSRSFRSALKSPELQAQIGLVAIDECHLVQQWKDFRPAFTLLGELRTILRRDIVWFGCSATVDEETELRVLKSTGFRPVGNAMYETEVIRTSIDRLDVSVAVVPIQKGKLSTWDSLYFLLNNAVSNNIATPNCVPKTVVFIDGRISLQAAADWFRQALVAKTKDLLEDQQFTTDPLDGARCVFNVIEVFTAHVSDFDQKQRYEEFRLPTSIIRIMFATTSLGMGINISDIKRVVCWRFPITMSIADMWQRLGRGGRSAGAKSSGYVFLPYWVFDSEGYSNVVEEAVQPASTTIPPARARRMKNQLPSQAPRRANRSQLAKSYTPDSMMCNMTPGDSAASPSTLESTTSGTLAAEPDDSESENVVPDTGAQGSRDAQGRKPWTKAEREARSAVPEVWFKMVNGSCHREAFLRSLGEYKLPPEDRMTVEKEECCSHCNPLLLPPQTEHSSTDKPPSRPRKGTLSYFAFISIEKWAIEQAALLCRSAFRRYSVPAAAFMSAELQYALSFACGSRSISNAVFTMPEWIDLAPRLAGWSRVGSHGDVLVSAMPDISATAKSAYELYRLAAGVSRHERQVAQVLDVDAPGTNRVVAARNRDNNLAREVALRAASRATASAPMVSSSLLMPHISLSSTADSFVESMASTSGRETNMLAASPATPSTPPPASTPVHVRSSKRRRVTVARDVGSPRTPTTRGSVTPSRRPLSQIDVNVPGPLTFAATTRTGRKRTITEKGRGYFNT